MDALPKDAAIDNQQENRALITKNLNEETAVQV